MNPDDFDLSALADRITAKAAELREQDIRHLNHDGTCKILRVDRNVFYPMLAEIHTDLDERLAVYRDDLVDLLTTAERSGRRVALTLGRNFRHRRYVRSAQLLPTGEEESYACIKCGALVSRDSVERVFKCGCCHYIMRQ